jgi:hypothetical protein
MLLERFSAQKRHRPTDMRRLSAQKWPTVPSHDVGSAGLNPTGRQKQDELPKAVRPPRHTFQPSGSVALKRLRQRFLRRKPPGWTQRENAAGYWQSF